MTDYEAYLEEKNLSYNNVVSVLAGRYPAFTKSVLSMCVNGDRYAVALIPAAEEILVETYGEGPGLSISPKLRKRHARRMHNTLRPNQLCVRLNDTLFKRMQALMSRMGFQTNQDFLEAAVVEFCNRHERGAFRFASPKSR